VQVVAVEAAVAFDSNGAISSGIVTHVPGTAGIVVVNAGTYEIAFALSESNRISLRYS
jgi:hypothetical protein